MVELQGKYQSSSISLFVLSRIASILLLGVLVLLSCREKTSNPNKELTLDAFSELEDERYRIDVDEIRENIAGLAGKDKALSSVDRQVGKYYSDSNPFIWINRNGLYDRTDTLLSIISQASRQGLNLNMLRVARIQEDIKRIRNLNIDADGQSINMVLARLEYNLTRAYFRYASYTRFGLVNPDYFYNNLEEVREDSVVTRYKNLSEIRAERPNRAFYECAVSKAFNDSVGEFLTALQPRNELYAKLIKRLNSERLSKSERIKTICNIERCRWRLKLLSKQSFPDKYIEVNIPSYSLRAIDKGDVLQMRVGCGTVANKTPLLASRITRMDVNPQWIVPKSISKGFVSNYEYMHKMGMFVFDKKEGKLPPEQASYEKVMNGEQYIIQSGGPKNSLGRIIFRFDNNFSVFLHDTSSPWVFQRERRAVSHGCVRVEKPYELAKFLLGDIDSETEEKLKYSMTVRLVNDNDSLAKNKVDRKRLVNSLYVKPSIPLFITYFTVYYGGNGELADYQDVYGYDEALAEKLKPYVE